MPFDRLSLAAIAGGSFAELKPAVVDLPARFESSGSSVSPMGYTPTAETSTNVVAVPWPVSPPMPVVFHKIEIPHVTRIFANRVMPSRAFKPFLARGNRRIANPRPHRRSSSPRRARAPARPPRQADGDHHLARRVRR